MDFLIVDNDSVFLKLLEKLLKKEGHHVLTAVDGLSALDILRDYTPDFIFIDYVMPNIDGGSLCKILKKDKSLKNSFIVILSAVAAEEWSDCCSSGADAYIAKAPFNIMKNYVLDVIDDKKSAKNYCSAGKVIGINEIIPRGITGELLTSKKHYKQLLNKMSEGVLELNAEKRIVYANPPALRFFAKPEHEILGLSIFDLFSDFPKNMIDSLLEKLYQDLYEHNEERTISFEDKHIALKSTHLDGSENHSLILIEDITDLKNSEISLRDANNLLNSILDSSQSYSIISTDLDQNIIFWNKGAEKMFGYTSDEVVGKKKITILYTDDAQHQMTARFSKSAELGRKTLSFETRELTKKGEELWVKIHMSPRLDDEGNVVGILGIGENITELKKMEEEKEELQNQVLHARKSESIGTLAGGIAHDFNNLLMGIQGHITIAKLKEEKGEFLGKNLTSIEDCVTKGASLTEKLLNLAKGGKGPVAPKNLNSIIIRSVEIFEKGKKNLRIDLDLSKDLWEIDLNEMQINQVLLNLFDNALSAMGGKGLLSVRTANRMLSEPFVKPHKLSAGKYVEIEIRDTGIGMNQETLEKIFDPFFTTRMRGAEKGAGLGLATVYATIKNHHGMIKVKSKIGEGAIFTIYLPASKNFKMVPLKDAPFSQSNKRFKVEGKKHVRF